MFTAHGQRRLFTSFQSKIWPRLSLRRHLFPVTVEKLFCENTCSLFCDFFSAHAQKRLFRSFRSKVWPPPFAPSTSISYKQDVFPLPSDVYWIGLYSMFLCYCVAWPCDLDLWPFDLGSVLCILLLLSDAHTDFHYPTYHDYRLLNLITFPLSGTVIAHAQCQVTYHRGLK